MSKQIGFVGLGQMGRRMAVRFVQAGFCVSGFDPVPQMRAQAAEQGIAAVGSLKELAETCAIIFLSLPNGAIVKHVIFSEEGLLSGVRKPEMIADLSTIGPKAAIEIAHDLAPHTVAWVEAPVSGGPKGAEKGTLAMMLCCSGAVRQQAETLLSHLGKVFYTGEKPGLAQTAKLANNMLSTAAIVLTSEVMVMGAKAGLDPNVLLEIINAGSGRNSATVDKFPRAVVPRTFDYGFATGLSYKDMRLCVDEAENLGVPMILGAQVRQILAATNAKYGAQSDFTEVVRIYEEWAGVTVGTPSHS